MDSRLALLRVIPQPFNGVCWDLLRFVAKAAFGGFGFLRLKSKTCGFLRVIAAFVKNLGDLAAYWIGIVASQSLSPSIPESLAAVAAAICRRSRRGGQRMNVSPGEVRPLF